MEFVELLQYYIRSELVIVIPVLYLLGMLLRKTRTDEKRIPVILLIVSLAITALYTFSVCSVNTLKDFCYIMFSILTQGILLAGVETFIRGFVKGFSSKKSSNTSGTATSTAASAAAELVSGTAGGTAPDLMSVMKVVAAVEEQEESEETVPDKTAEAVQAAEPDPGAETAGNATGESIAVETAQASEETVPDKTAETAQAAEPDPGAGTAGNAAGNSIAVETAQASEETVPDKTAEAVQAAEPDPGAGTATVKGTSTGSEIAVSE